MSGSSYVAISGWVFAKKTQIKTLTVSVNGAQKGNLTYGLKRPDVASIYPNQLGATSSGFSGFVDIGLGEHKKAKITLVATLEDGRKRICLSRSFSMRGTKSTKFSLIIFVHDLIALFRKAFFLYRSGQLPNSIVLWDLAFRKALRLFHQAELRTNLPLSELTNNNHHDAYSTWLDTNKPGKKLKRLMKS